MTNPCSQIPTWDFLTPFATSNLDDRPVLSVYSTIHPNGTIPRKRVAENLPDLTNPRNVPLTSIPPLPHTPLLFGVSPFPCRTLHHILRPRVQFRLHQSLKWKEQPAAFSGSRKHWSNWGSLSRNDAGLW